MILRLYSDVHTEVSAFTPPDVHADVVILAGDIGVGTRGVVWAIEHFGKLGVPVLYVPGNHEGYGHDIPRVFDKMKDAAKGTNVHVLIDEGFVHNDVAFFGGTLWTDMCLNGELNRPFTEITCARRMNDYWKIKRSENWSKFRPFDSMKLHHRTRRGIEEFLRAPLIGFSKRVVITHHLPSPRSLSAEYAGDEVNAAYASDLEYLFTAGRGPDLWVHGHVHHAVDYLIDRTRVVSNPRGYYGDAMGFDPARVLEV